MFGLEASMNVLLVTPFEFRDTGGVSVVVRTLGEHFQRYGDHPVYLIAREGKGEAEEFEGGVRVYRANLRPPLITGHGLRSRIAFLLLFLPTCWKLMRILRREKIEIVNVHYFDPCWIYFFVLGRLLGRKLVVSVHGSDVLGADGPSNVRWLERWSGWLDRVVFCSDGFRRQVLPAASLLHKKSAVVWNGIALEDLPEAADASTKTNSVVCVAHLRQHKGQDVLIRAFQQIAAEFPELTLKMAGQGPFAPELERLTRELKLQDRVCFLGDLPRQEALRTIAGASVFCLPSRREPFGLVILEAMALGVPVVSTRVGGIPEIIRTGVEGLLVDPDSPAQLSEALRKILREGVTRQGLIQQARLRVQSCFLVEHFFANYRQLFLSLQNQHFPPG